MIAVRDSVLLLSGPMTAATATAMLEQGRQALQQGCRRIDFAEVAGADSAGLAVLLAWLRWAQGNGQTLQLGALPAGLRSLAELYGVAEFLPA